jgi:tRNA(Ile2) C34 agmatinyltransferase TiaS
MPVTVKGLLKGERRMWRKFLAVGTLLFGIGLIVNVVCESILMHAYSGYGEHAEALAILVTCSKVLLWPGALLLVAALVGAALGVAQFVAPAANVCPQCGGSVKPGAGLFCPRCGTKLQA